MTILAMKRKTAVAVSFFQSLLRQRETITILEILLASCFISVCAQVKIPLYFTPVPITLLTFSVMLVGALLGSRKGALAVLCYLLQGCVGLPVWAGGAAGFAHLMGPTGGYRIGCVVQAFLIGWFLERQTHAKSLQMIGIFILSICIQMGIGSLWLAQFVGLDNCFLLGFYPFIFGEGAKAALLGFYLKTRLFSNLKG
jgi:biotin transport system substrate-specific component